jgi:hypothetical protein
MYICDVRQASSLIYMDNVESNQQNYNFMVCPEQKYRIAFKISSDSYFDFQ